MPWGEIGAFLLFLVAVFIFGNLWFHFIEAILRRIKKIFTHHKNLQHGIHSPRIRRTERIFTYKFLYQNKAKCNPVRQSQNVYCSGFALV